MYILICIAIAPYCSSYSDLFWILANDQANVDWFQCVGAKPGFLQAVVGKFAQVELSIKHWSSWAGTLSGPVGLWERGDGSEASWLLSLCLIVQAQAGVGEGFMFIHRELFKSFCSFCSSMNCPTAHVGWPTGWRGRMLQRRRAELMGVGKKRFLSLPGIWLNWSSLIKRTGSWPPIKHMDVGAEDVQTKG